MGTYWDSLKTAYRGPQERSRYRRIDSLRMKLLRLYEAVRTLYDDCMTYTRMIMK